MVDVALQNTWILHRVNKEDSDSSYSLSAFRWEVVNALFLKYSSENPSKRNLSYIAIKDVPSDVPFNDARHYRVPSEKQGRCKVCKKNSRRSCNKSRVNLHDECFETFHGY